MLIDVPTTLAAPWEVSWGWIATPVRPPTPGYRGWLTGNCDLSPGYQWYVPRGTDFDPRWLGCSRFIGSKARPDGQGKCTASSGPYVVTSMCALGVPEYAYWGDEWSPSRFGRRVEGGVGQCSVGSASWVDYFVSCYRQLYQRGRYLGLYYDCAAHLPDDNVYHGGGYRQEGKIVTVNPVLGAVGGSHSGCIACSANLSLTGRWLCIITRAASTWHFSPGATCTPMARTSLRG